VEISRRKQIMLAAFAADRAASFAPVQVQKMFFLFDRNIVGDIGGPQFAFEPYDYGPFDREVYSELGDLARTGLIRIEAMPDASRRRYSLTAEGYELGKSALDRLNPRAQAYMSRVSAWVRSLSFAELVGSIYRQYPDMKCNSVFRG
jgi:hypothetical protein